jgi:lipoprotein-releasing system ATP-binding protein
MNKQSILSAINLSKVYKDQQQGHVILDQISFSIQAGQVHCILGPSGSGKTTFLNCISGLDIFDSGSVSLFGEQLGQMKSHSFDSIKSSKLGFIYQSHHLLLHLSTLENTMLPAIIAGASVANAKSEAMQLLNDFGLEDSALKQASALSGGERQRTAIARAMINRPLLLIADEPTGNLDQNNAKIILDQLYAACLTHNTACVLATHDMDCIRPSAYIHYLEHGKLTSKTKETND